MVTAKQLTTTILLLSTIYTFNLKAQTTLEEYNYLTKGYKVQIESGLDMKKGYELSDIEKRTTSERNAELKVLHRIKDGKREIAGYLVIYNKTGGAKEYICIPNSKSEEEILTKYWTQLYDGSNDSSARLQLICYLITGRLLW